MPLLSKGRKVKVDTGGSKEVSKPVGTSSKALDWRKAEPEGVHNMAHSFETGLYSDVSFKVGPTGVTINAHTQVLMMRSEIFARMFSERWTPTDPKEDRRIVNLPEYNPEPFRHFLKFLYNDELPKAEGVSVGDALEILDLARLYQVHLLITKCADFIWLKILDDNSCVEICERARLYAELRFSKTIIWYLNRNISKVLSSDQFLLLDVTMLKNLLENGDIVIKEIDLFKALLRWGNVEWNVKDLNGQEKPRKEVMQSLIPLIRFLLISNEDFVKEVIPTKVLSDTQALEIMCARVNGDAEKNEQMKNWSKPRGQADPKSDSDSDSGDSDLDW